MWVRSWPPSVSCGVSRRLSLGLELLWLWPRPVATAPIQLLAWQPPYAAGTVLKRQKKKKKNAIWCAPQAVTCSKKVASTSTSTSDRFVLPFFFFFFFVLYINGVLQYVLFCAWLLLLYSISQILHFHCCMVFHSVTVPCFIYSSPLSFFFLSFFWVTLTACGNSQARDQTYATVVIYNIAVTTLDL